MINMKPRLDGVIV